MFGSSSDTVPLLLSGSSQGEELAEEADSQESLLELEGVETSGEELCGVLEEGKSGSEETAGEEEEGSGVCPGEEEVLGSSGLGSSVVMVCPFPGSVGISVSPSAAHTGMAHRALMHRPVKKRVRSRAFLEPVFRRDENDLRLNCITKTPVSENIG